MKIDPKLIYMRDRPIKIWFKVLKTFLKGANDHVGV